MKGYVRGKQYEVGQTYHGIDVYAELDTLIRLYERGKSDFFGDRYTCRFFEVEASGIINHKIITSTMADVTITRELSDLEVNRAAYGYCGCKDYGGDGTGDGCGEAHEGHCGCLDTKLYGYGNGSGSGKGYINEYCRYYVCDYDRDSWPFGDGYIGSGEGNGRGDACNDSVAEYISSIEDIGIFIGG